MRARGRREGARPSLAESIDSPRERTAPEAWHWQPHHLTGRKELWHAMLLEADKESVRTAAHWPQAWAPMALLRLVLHTLGRDPSFVFIAYRSGLDDGMSAAAATFLSFWGFN